MRLYEHGLFIARIAENIPFIVCHKAIMQSVSLSHHPASHLHITETLLCRVHVNLKFATNQTNQLTEANQNGSNKGILLILLYII